MATTRVEQLVRAPRAAVYRALVVGDAVQVWMVSDGMSSEVHEFDARVGGRFVELVPDEAVVQVVEFDDTVVTGIHENLPSGVSPDDNETGWRMSLGKLASFVERAEEDT